MNFDGRGIHFRNQNLSKIDVKNDGAIGLAQEPHFDWFLMNFGGILASKNGAKTFKNRCWNDVKNWSFFEGRLERHFCGQNAPKGRQTWVKRVGPAECAGSLGRIMDGYDRQVFWLKFHFAKVRLGGSVGEHSFLAGWEYSVKIFTVSLVSTPPKGIT